MSDTRSFPHGQGRWHPGQDDPDGDLEDSGTPTAPQIIALHLDKNHLGFSLYDSLNGTLHIGSADHLDLAPHHDRVHALLAMYLPTVVLVAARSALASVIAQSDPSVAAAVSLVVEERPAQDFVYANARAKLAQLVAGLNRDLPQNAPIVTNSNAARQALSQLDALLGGDPQSNALSVSSAGALCRFLDALRSVKDKHLAHDTKRHLAGTHWGTRSTLASTPTPPPGSRLVTAASTIATTLSRARPHPLAVDDPYLDNMSVAGSRPGTMKTESLFSPTDVYDFAIHGVSLITPTDTLHLPSSTQSALQLFDTPGSTPPSTQFTCVMSVLDATRSADGKWRLRQWMARPLANATEITRRLDAVEYLTKPENATLVRAIRGQLVHVKPLGKVLGKPVLGPGEWKAILSTMRAGVAIVEALSSTFESSPSQAMPDMLRVLVVGQGERTNDLVQAASRTIRLIDEVIDLDASTRDQRCVVRLGIDELLDDLKCQFDELPSLLADVAADVAHTLAAPLAPHVNVVYLPQIGYLVLLPRHTLDAYLSALRAPLDTFAVPGLELQFSTPAYGYFKSARMRDLDASLGDIYGMITDRELEIVFVMRAAVGELDALVRELHTHLVTLDVLVSLAEAAQRFGYTRPRVLVADSGDAAPLIASNVRHPLLERVGATLIGKPLAKTYIANDVALGGAARDSTRPRPRTCLLTGANASGKSVYLKSVALLVYLAHLGSFVPAAEGARVPLTDAILTRMAACDSVSQLGSAFMHDVQQVAHIVRRATRSSLILIDEFGKGTSVSDGIGLVAGVIEYLAKGGAEADSRQQNQDGSQDKRAQCGPLVIAATHFHDILTHDLLPRDLAIGILTTQILLHPAGATSGSTSPELVFLYRVEEFTRETAASATSYAAHCARLAGVPPRIVGRGVLAAHAIEAGEQLARVDQQACRECERNLEQILGAFLIDEVRSGEASKIINRIESEMNSRVEGGVFERLVSDKEEDKDGEEECAMVE